MQVVCVILMYISQKVLCLPELFLGTIGHEPAGHIVEVGEGVTSRKIGDRVGVTIFSSVMRKVRMVSAREADVLCTNDWHRHRNPRKPR